MREGSLFTGTNALGLAAAEVFGSTPAWFADLDPGATALLAHHYPTVPNLGDITRVGLDYSDDEWKATQARAAVDDAFEMPEPDWSGVEPVELLTGGFPCQDISPAGKRKGLKPGTRSGLWSYYAHAISQLHPTYVLIENVRGLASAEAHSDVEPCPFCMGDRADEPVLRALGAVLGDLADLGYRVAWVCLPASAVGAPHKRERFFLAAVAEDTDGAAGGERRLAASGQAEGGRARADAGGRGRALAADTDRSGVRKQPELVTGSRGQAVAELDRADVAASSRNASADTDRGGLSRFSQRDSEPEGSEAEHRDNREDAGGRVLDWAQYTPVIERWQSVLGRPAPVPTVVGARGGRVLSPALPEWMMGLPEGWITGVPGLSRNQQLKLAGNGVVPHQAVVAFRYLLEVLERDARAAA